jgi:hypothetical protein
MRSDQSIKEIALAAIRRHSIGMDTWIRTHISNIAFPPKIERLKTEIPVTFFWIDKDNWTIVTTQRVLGEIDSKHREMRFDVLGEYVFGAYKRNDLEKTIFRLNDWYGEQCDFLMETGNPSMAIIYSIKTIDELYRAST